MKTIKIFLASSEELDYDRMAFGNLVRRLDDMYEKRGIRIKLFEWEDYDSAYNDKRKQNEYNDYVRQCDIFLALFHKKAGQFTVEEFDIASQEFKDHASPKVYTYCKDLKSGEEETPELKEFKKRLFDEMGHFWCRYDNRESLQFQFVMQLQLVESSQMTDMKVEDGNVTLNGLPIASMDKLKFASCNEEFLKMNEELASLPPKIEKARMRLEKFPDDEDLQDDLQTKLNRYNQLKKDFNEYQQILFDTAKRIAQLQGEKITERMRRAMDAFNDGKVREANIILDEAEADARRNLEDYKQSKEITELKRQAVINSIEELLLKTSTIMADASIPIEERIGNTEKLYAQADEMARETEYDKNKFAQILLDYGDFLKKYARYTQAEDIYKRLIVLSEEIYGKIHSDTAIAYNNVGCLYDDMGKYTDALKYHFRAQEIREEVLGKDDLQTATSYNNIGLIYNQMGDYPKAMEYFRKALDIYERILGAENDYTSTAYNNIGCLLENMGEYSNSLEYHLKALVVDEKLLGINNPETAKVYNNIGIAYHDLGNYQEALNYYNKALTVDKETLGMNHPETAKVHNNIGCLYDDIGEYQKGLDNHLLALKIREKVLGKEHPHTAQSYHNIGVPYDLMGDQPKALHYYLKALEIQERVLGKEHLETAKTNNCIGGVYDNQGDYRKALEYYKKGLDIQVKVLGQDHPDVLKTYNLLGTIYREIEDYHNALVYRQKELDYHLRNSGDKSIKTAIAYNNVGAQYRDLTLYDKAIEYISKAYEIAVKLEDSTAKASYLNRIGRVYALMGNLEMASKKYKEAIDLLPEDHPEAVDSQNRLKEIQNK